VLALDRELAGCIRAMDAGEPSDHR
jgi:hypothetical protein